MKRHCGAMPPWLALEPLEDRHLLAISLSTLDNFEDGTTLGWSEGAGSSNPPTHVTDGGPAGAGDGFLRNVSGGFGAGSRLAMFNESGQWTGDYVSAGVTRIDAQLANFGTSPLAMQIAIATGPLLGPSRTSWYASSDAVNIPPDGAWHAVSFSLASDSLSRVQGSNSLSTLLADVTEIRILSNVSGPDFRGDRIAATLGVDDIQAVAAANIAPEVSTTNADLSYQENQAATFIDTGLTVIDDDSVTLTSARVSITSGFAPGEDVLEFTDQLGIVANVDAVNGMLTLTGAASVADYQTALRSVTYANTSDSPSVAPRTITFLVDDGLAMGSAVRNINITATNDAPDINTTSLALNFSQNQGPTAVDSGLTVSDVDSVNLIGATVSISAGFAPGEDVLAFSDQLGITSDFDAAAGVLTLSGIAAVEIYQASLRSITYDNTSDTPSTSQRTVSIQVNDGEDTAAASRDIIIAALFTADFGDAADTYPTTLERDGASHLATGPRLGGSRDAEADGQPTSGADGDDLDGIDDEDGVTLHLIWVGQTGATFAVNVQNAPAAALLDVWIDFNGDGTWEASEQIADSLSVTNGDNVVTFDVPLNVTDGTTVARFRLSTAGDLEPSGPAADGEVEDHQIEISNVSWHNFDNPFDVNGVDGTSPLDALLVINELTGRVFSDPITGHLSVVGSPPPYLDVTNDGVVSPLDALLVINELPSTSRAPSSAALPLPSANRFTADRFAEATGLFRQPSISEVVELEQNDLLPDRDLETGIQHATRRTLNDAAIRTFPDAHNRAANQLDSLRREHEAVKAADITDDLFAAW